MSRMGSEASAGTVVVHRIASEALRGNALGDPTERDLHVYLPPGYDGKQPLPVLVALAGFGGTGPMLFNFDPLGEDLKRRLDRLITTGRCAPVIVAVPDAFTRVGGTQYIDSSAVGSYERYVAHDIVRFVARTYPIGRVGVFGKSSGGYGAAVLAMRNPDVFSAFADHSGDANFELCYMADFSEALDRYREAGGPAKWLERFWADENRHRKKHMRPLNVLAMSAHYSPNPAAPELGVDFPFDLETGIFRPEVWERWRAWDPVHMAEKHADALRSMRLVYVDCGARDEYSLHWGARAFVQRIREAGVAPIHEEFDDGHSSISYRYDVSLPLLVKALRA
jgi:S-formylglutathione hydrolase FrmB